MRNKIATTSLLVLLALANAALDFSALCLFFDVDPFGQFSPSNFFAACVALAQSMLLVALPAVAAEKAACREKGAAAIAMAAALLVALFGSLLRATTEAATTTTSVSGEAIAGLSMDGIAFCLIMAGIGIGEALVSYLIKSIGIKNEAQELVAEIERLKTLEAHVDGAIASAADVALSAGRQSVAAAKQSCEQVYQGLVAKSDDSYNSFIGYADQIGIERERELEEISRISADFEARIREKGLAENTGATHEAPRMAKTLEVHNGREEGGSASAAANTISNQPQAA